MILVGFKLYGLHLLSIISPTATSHSQKIRSRWPVKTIKMLKGSSLSLLPPPNLRRKHKAQKKFNSKTRYKCAAAALISKDFAVAFGELLATILMKYMT